MGTLRRTGESSRPSCYRTVKLRVHRPKPTPRILPSALEICAVAGLLSDRIVLSTVQTPLVNPALYGFSDATRSTPYQGSQTATAILIATSSVGTKPSFGRSEEHTSEL